MATTYQAAKDEMFAAVYNMLISSLVTTLLGYTPDIRFSGVAEPNEPDRTKYWVRISLQVVTDQQISLMNAYQNALFQADGLLYIQIFCPRNKAASIDNGLIIALAVQNVFRNQSADGQVWYTKQRVQELPEDDLSYPILVSTRFTYKTESQVIA
jgi:hypothetical protein